MKQKAILYLTWIIRFIAGGLFLFSGFVKAIDPWGTLFKINDYLSVFSIGLWHNLRLAGVFGLCALEFVTGIFFITGCFRRSWPIIGALIMCFMLPVTLWVAMANPVADCGCFGDALILSNWTTFWKNIILSALIIWLVIYNRRADCIITPALQWLALVFSGVFIIVIELFGYNYQPLLDFRPYPIGSSLYSENDNDYENDYEFIYSNGKEEKVFKIDDDLPDENSEWKFKYRKDIVNHKEKAENQRDSDFKVFDREGENDETEEAILTEGKELIVFIPELEKVSPATTWKLNSLSEWSEQNDVKMIGVVSGSLAQIEEWEDLSMPGYPIYTAEDTVIKEVVRGNPGIVYLVDGKIRWKSTLAAINIDDFLSPDTSHDADTFDYDNNRILMNCVWLYLIVLAVLIFLSMAPKISGMIFGKSSLKHHYVKNGHNENESSEMND